jgi:hypothetical protein
MIPPIITGSRSVPVYIHGMYHTTFQFHPLD